ncbi:MAG: VanZ family protein [Microbacterium sp.]|uniref:VanZ family protein n=1 Tax=Microbacterium sp. TaxID=51671 RepID=UPI002636316B|nr:VanZ family protein [Microbacterium sp.]MCX6502191.1 VanZ family protein [Microbacterium sp.]
MTDAVARRVRGRILLTVLTAGYLAVLGSLTLGPQPEGAGGGLRAMAAVFATWPVTAWLTFEVLEFAANIVLFLPAGLLAALWLPPRRRWLAVPAGLVLSAAIEAAQALFFADRVPDPRDLLANTLGAAVGYVILRRFGPRPHPSR